MNNPLPCPVCGKLPKVVPTNPEPENGELARRLLIHAERISELHHPLLPIEAVRDLCRAAELLSGDPPFKEDAQAVRPPCRP